MADVAVVPNVSTPGRPRFRVVAGLPSPQSIVTVWRIQRPGSLKVPEIRSCRFP